MEEMDKKSPDGEQEEQEVYVPRPAWQVWGARIALLLFIALILMYYFNIARGGL